MPVLAVKASITFWKASRSPPPQFAMTVMVRPDGAGVPGAGVPVAAAPGDGELTAAGAHAVTTSARRTSATDGSQCVRAVIRPPPPRRHLRERLDAAWQPTALEPPPCSARPASLVARTSGNGMHRLQECQRELRRWPREG